MARWATRPVTDRGAEPSAAPARSAARLAAVQALYQMEAAGQGVEATIREFESHRLDGDLEGVKLHEADARFFSDILRGAVERQGELDPLLTRHLAKGWKLTRIDATARAILRAGFYELVARSDVPVRTIIDEYVNLGHAFFDGEEPNFINAVLDAAARETRADELQA